MKLATNDHRSMKIPKIPSVRAMDVTWALGSGIYEGRVRSFRFDQEMVGSRGKNENENFPQLIIFKERRACWIGYV